MTDIMVDVPSVCPEDQCTKAFGHELDPNDADHGQGMYATERRRATVALSRLGAIAIQRINDPEYQQTIIELVDTVSAELAFDPVMAIPTTPGYEKQRLAEVVAECTSGIQGSIPQADDYELAEKLLLIIEPYLSDSNG